MFFSTILAAALANTTPAAAPVDANFTASCRASTQNLEDIKNDEPSTLRLIETAIDIIKMGGSDQHLKNAIALYAVQRELKGRVTYLRDLSCHLAETE